MKVSTFAFLAALGLTTTVAMAQHNDVLISQSGSDSSSQLVLGAADLGDDGEPGGVGIDADTYSLGLRVFEGELEAGDDGTNFFYTGDEPGFNGITQATHNALATGGFALDGDFLALASSNVTIDAATGHLFAWDGIGSVDFNPVAAGITFFINGQSGSVTFDGTTDGLAGTGATFAIGGDGTLHQHPVYTVDDTSTNTVPPAAFYLVSMTATTFGQTDTSDTFFLVLDAGVENETQHEAAVDWVNDNFTTIPEPATAVLTLAGIGVMLARRRCVA